MTEDNPKQEPIEVPHGGLSPLALQRVIESFVLREGTEYGSEEVSLERKVEQVRRQLELGKAVILFDPVEETIDIKLSGLSKS